MGLFSYRRFRRKLVTFSLAGLIVAIAIFIPHHIHQQDEVSGWFPLVNNSASAQPITVDRRDIARQVHALLPELPPENHYLHSETGEVDRDNSLVHRLIQYHYDVKSRPLTSRFDWKLTLADYLGANEVMDVERYPDRRLRTNPYANDVEVIRTLNRQQREALIQTLLTVIADR